MKQAKYFDVHDKNLTPEIYSLLFTEALFERQGNDAYYRLYLEDMEEDIKEAELEGDESYFLKTANDQFAQRLARGANNCYHNKEQMQRLCDNPITGIEAVKQFVQWLKDEGVDLKHDTVFVKVWW